jgi:hypothetical protein
MRQCGKKILEPVGSQTTIWRYAHCFLAETHICDIHCFSTATMVARTRLNVTLYIHCMYCCVLDMSE